MNINPPLTGAEIILTAAAVFGILDLSCTLVVNKLQGLPVKRTLQFIASGVLGKQSFAGGVMTSSLGLGIHFIIAVLVAGFYYEASHNLRILMEHPIVSGMLYGLAVHLFMAFVVLPLSRARRVFSTRSFVTQSIIHIFCVGLPVSSIIHYFD